MFQLNLILYALLAVYVAGAVTLAIYANRRMTMGVWNAIEFGLLWFIAAFFWLGVWGLRWINRLFGH